MTNNQDKQTPSSIRYLMIINELSYTDAGVRGVDIAKELSVTKPSVYTMLKLLTQKGLAYKGKYEAVHLTKRGEELAAQYTKCFELLNKKMSDYTGVVAKNCERASCVLLSEIPCGELIKLVKKLR